MGLCPSPLGVSRESFLKFSDLCPELIQYFRSGILRHVNLAKEKKKIQFTTVELDETDKPLSGDLIVRSLGTDSRTVRAVMDRKTLFCWDNKVPYLVIPVSGCFVETNE